MKYQLTRAQLEEMVLCIVDNHLNQDEAMEYALSVCGEFAADDAEVAWPETEERIGGVSLFPYGKVAQTGAYD